MSYWKLRLTIIEAAKRRIVYLAIPIDTDIRYERVLHIPNVHMVAPSNSYWLVQFLCRNTTFKINQITENPN